MNDLSFFNRGRRRDTLEAARWALRMEERLSAQERLELEDWLTAKPTRQILLAEMQGVQALMRKAGATQTAAHESAARPAMHLSTGKSTATRWTLGWPHWTLASCALIVIVLQWLLNQGVERTGYSQLRSITLADGSRIDLNADSRVRISESAPERRVEIIDGEVYFSVRHDPARPFVVIANNQRIVDIGTEFNVKARDDSMRLYVAEGEVSVNAENRFLGSAPVAKPRALNAGQLAVFDQRQLRGLTTDAGSREQELAWRQRRLMVDNQTLAEVIAELNHHTPYKVIVVGDALRQRSVGGVFDVSHPQTVIDLLARTLRFKRTEVTPYLLVLWEGDTFPSVLRGVKSTGNEKPTNTF